MASWGVRPVSGRDFAEACGEQKVDSELVVRALDRVLLSPRVRDTDVPETREIRQVCVFGPHHSGTNALMRELSRFFDVDILNVHYDDNPQLWKHRVFRKTPELPEGAFCVCLVKDPFFWIQSLARNPWAGTFYELLPVRVVRAGYDIQFVPSAPCGTSQLFSTILFDDILYHDAVDLWEATVASYFDDRIFSRAKSVVVRYEDFLLRFGDVMDALVARGFPLRREAPPQWCPLAETAKDESHPRCTRRSRDELLQYYQNSENRKRGLRENEISRLDMADSTARPLGYGDPPLTR